MTMICSTMRCVSCWDRLWRRWRGEGPTGRPGLAELAGLAGHLIHSRICSRRDSYSDSHSRSSYNNSHHLYHNYHDCHKHKCNSSSWRLSPMV